MNTRFAEIFELPIKERIQLVEDLWDSIAAFPDEIELTPEQRDEIDRRVEDYRKNPESGIPWEKIKAEALSRK